MRTQFRKFAALVGTLASVTLAAGIGSMPAQAADPNFALHFSGSTNPTESEVLVFNGPALTKNFTVEADVRWDGTMNYEGILSKAGVDTSVSSETGYCLGLSSGQPVLALKDATHTNRVYFAPNAITPNVWHTIIATYDGQQSTIYVDGTLAGTSANFGSDLPVLQSSEPVVIGREFQNSTDPDLSTRAFHGDLDNVQTFDGVYPATLSPVMNYPFIEGTGRRVVDQGPLGSASWLSVGTTPTWVQGSDPITITYSSQTGHVITRTARPYDTINLEVNNLFDRNGYVFQGWQVDGTSTTLDAGSSFVVPLTDTTINATWDAAPTVMNDGKTLAETGAINVGGILAAALGAALFALGASVLVLQKKRG